MTPSRREFVRTLARGAGAVAAGALGVACGPGAQAARADSAANPAAGATAARRDSAAAPTGRPIGAALYTVRDLMEKDAAGTLAAVAALGYREVELVETFEQEPARLRAQLDAAGLSAPSAHHPIDALRRDLDRVLAAATTLGHRYVVCPWLAEDQRTAAHYRRLAADLGRIGRACRDRGLTLAYHNHEFEFDGTVFRGTTPYDVLLAETDPALVRMELDLYWVTHAGRDPLAYFDKHPGRFPLWHIKDIRDPRGAKTIVPVGEGAIDFARIFAAGERAGLRHFFVEHDNPVDPLASLRAGYAHLRRLLA